MTVEDMGTGKMKGNGFMITDKDSDDYRKGDEKYSCHACAVAASVFFSLYSLSYRAGVHPHPDSCAHYFSKVSMSQYCYPCIVGILQMER